MRRSNKLYALDMFCGAGGFSEGLSRAAASRGLGLKLAAVDRWDTAVATHAVNHTRAQHYCCDVADLDADTPWRGRRLDLLIASPECTNHSVALSAKPRNEESRAGAWQVLRVAKARRPRAIVIENVPRFMAWGPLDSRGRVVKARAGETFVEFIGALAGLGYKVECRELVAASYGDATTRNRLFIQATLDKAPAWPEPTHSQAEWVPARDIIDWTRRGRSMFRRRVRPKPPTWQRVAQGLYDFGGIEFLNTVVPGDYSKARPFLIRYYGQCKSAYSIDLPVGTITTRSTHALAVPTDSDIELRTLYPAEMAAAMGFGSYRFCGNVQDVYRQVGNAVAVGTATALMGKIIDHIFVDA